MKVLLIGQLPKEIGGNYTTGAANVVYELGKRQPHDVSFFTYGTNIKNDVAERISNYEFQYLGYKINPFKIISNIIRHPQKTYKHLLHYRNVDHQNIFRYLFYEDNIDQTIKKVQPDLIHVHSINNMSPVYFALNGKHIPILLTCHGIYYRGDINDKINRDRYFGNLHFANAYSGLTKESIKEYEQYLKIPKEQVNIIPNGIDCEKFQFSISERIVIRNAYNVQDGCIIFLTVASVQDRKGQLEFIKVLEQIEIEYQYWIIGVGPQELEIRQYVNLHGLTDKVKLLGYKDSESLYKYYSAADIYAHTSWKEGQALSELEANATGLRIIVNKCVSHTIVSDTSSNECHILDFGKIDLTSLNYWIKQGQQNRCSKMHMDWRFITEMYANLYKKIIENYHK